MENKYFVLYSDCIPVKGYTRSLIYDLGRSNFIFIENIHFTILSKGAILFGGEDDELINFLVKEDVGFITNTPSLFPPIENIYRPIEHISNAIIEIKESLEWFKLFLKNNTTSEIRFVEIRFFSDEPTMFYELVNLIKSSNIECITLCVQNYKLITDTIDDIDENLLRIKKDFPELKTIAFFNCPLLKNYILDGDIYVILNKTELKNQNCGKIAVVNFNISVQSFVESISCNSCLNQKISLSSCGKVKNCPSINDNYGRIDEVDLEKVIHNKDFLKYNISKDNISVCKDCEFRYMCHDCRAYLPANEINHKPKYCNYNPYTTLWEEN
jgi:SPASM domain peptide maturase of grasp-with-spasm system